MDYEYYDESRTRFQFQSGPQCGELEEENKQINLVEVGSCCILGLLFLCLAWYTGGLLQFSLLWLAFALFVGPFAPNSATGGDCRVGVGELLPPVQAEQKEEPSEVEAPSVRSFKKQQKVVASNVGESISLIEKHVEHKKVDQMKGSVVQNGNVISDSDDVNGEEEVENDGDTSENDALYDYENSPQRSKDVTNMPDQNGLASVKGEAEWTPADIDLLKKLMVRYPKGMLKRWEVIAESFDGSHSVESIVKMSKAMAEKKKTNDDYSDFLAKRKGHANAIASPLSLRSDSDESGGENLKSAAENKDEIMQNGDGKESQKKKKSEWSDAEDKALLNALKMFPKDTPMRWEKVALAVPTRTKPQCFRRYSQLKEGFRNKMENN